MPLPHRACAGVQVLGIITANPSRVGVKSCFPSRGDGLDYGEFFIPALGFSLLGKQWEKLGKRVLGSGPGVGRGGKKVGAVNAWKEAVPSSIYQLVSAGALTVVSGVCGREGEDLALQRTY